MVDFSCRASMKFLGLICRLQIRCTPTNRGNLQTWTISTDVIRNMIKYALKTCMHTHINYTLFHQSTGQGEKWERNEREMRENYRKKMLMSKKNHLWCIVGWAWVCMWMNNSVHAITQHVWICALAQAENIWFLEVHPFWRTCLLLVQTPLIKM